MSRLYQVIAEESWGSTHYADVRTGDGGIGISGRSWQLASDAHYDRGARASAAAGMATLRFPLAAVPALIETLRVAYEDMTGVKP